MRKNEVILKYKWDVYNSSLLTSKIYRLINKIEGSKASIQVKHGSLETYIVIKLVSDAIKTYPAIKEIIKDIRRYVKNRKERVKRRKEKLPPLELEYNSEREII